MSKKTFWKSKTFWTNVVAVVAWIITDKQLSAEAMADVQQYFVYAVTLFNLILRLFFTKTNLTVTE